MLKARLTYFAVVAAVVLPAFLGKLQGLGLPDGAH